MRFVVDVRDEQCSTRSSSGKTQQYLRTGAVNGFAFAWTRALLEHIFHCHGEAFAGMLSALYAGDQLVAAHFGMRSAHVLHLWFPAHDPAFARASPGTIRDLELIRAMPALGIERFDFGKGMTESKEYFMCGAAQVAMGSVDRRVVKGALRRQWDRAYRWARTTPLRRPARLPARALYRFREWLSFR